MSRSTKPAKPYIVVFCEGESEQPYAEYELNRFSVSRCRKGSRGHFRLLGGRV